jgi:hypothetical protein
MRFNRCSSERRSGNRETVGDSLFAIEAGQEADEIGVGDAEMLHGWVLVRHRAGWMIERYLGGAFVNLVLGGMRFNRCFTERRYGNRGTVGDSLFPIEAGQEADEIGVGNAEMLHHDWDLVGHLAGWMIERYQEK